MIIEFQNHESEFWRFGKFSRCFVFFVKIQNPPKFFRISKYKTPPAMSSPLPMPISIPCCSPATTESVAVVRDKIGDARSDVLVGQGHILKTQGDYTSAILRDANANVMSLTATADRNAFAGMSQVDKYGLANLNASNAVSDNVTRSGYNGVAATHDSGDKLGLQANTIAWNQASLQNAGFSESRAQVERVNDAQTANSDRASKYLAGTISDSFGRLSAQGENGFYRTGQAVAATDKQVVQSEIGLTRTTADSFARLSNQTSDGFARQLAASIENGKQTVQSEMGVTRSVNAGFSDSALAAATNYARLSEQNCQTKEVIAAYGNRASDQTASVLATLSAQHAGITRDIGTVGKELTLQSANQFGVLQLEASKNTNAIQMQAAINSKESLLEQSKWFALAEKTAMVNKCDLEAKMAACCCEIKEVVVGSANATQALIQSGETNRVRDALSAAATENAILKLRRDEHHHYPPYPYPYPHHGGGSRRGSRS